MSGSSIGGLDLEVVLAPVSEGEPAGRDLREDFTPQSLYYRLRDARAEARAAERASDAGNAADAGTPPQWRLVRDIAGEALIVSKDIEVAAWLTEALLRSDGLIGFAAGVAVIHGVVDRFWDGLYPRPDEDGIATVVAPIAGLNGESGEGTLIQPLRKITMFSRPDGTPVAFWQYEQSRETAGIGDAVRKQQRLAAGVAPLETMETEARAAGAAWFASRRREIDAAAASWRLLAAALDARAGADSPSTGRVRDLLEEMRNAVANFAPPEVAEATSAADDAAADVAGVEADAGGRVSGAPARQATREDALRTLEEVAGFFRRTEPNSPLSYTLDDAVRRARMTWPELLSELVPDTSSRSTILQSLGIRPPPQE